MKNILAVALPVRSLTVSLSEVATYSIFLPLIVTEPSTCERASLGARAGGAAPAARNDATSSVTQRTGMWGYLGFGWEERSLIIVLSAGAAGKGLFDDRARHRHGAGGISRTMADDDVDGGVKGYFTGADSGA